MEEKSWWLIEENVPYFEDNMGFRDWNYQTTTSAFFGSEDDLLKKCGLSDEERAQYYLRTQNEEEKKLFLRKVILLSSQGQKIHREDLEEKLWGINQGAREIIKAMSPREIHELKRPY